MISEPLNSQRKKRIYSNNITIIIMLVASGVTLLTLVAIVFFNCSQECFDTYSENCLMNNSYYCCDLDTTEKGQICNEYINCIKIISLSVCSRLEMASIIVGGIFVLALLYYILVLCKIRQ